LGPQRFLNRLRKELPGWVERGWVTPVSAEAILQQVGAQSVGTHFLASALAVLGALLLGSGIITYFAANWDAMPKLVKLAVLLSSLWFSYGVGGYLLREDRYPRLAQALLLLGVILFGANVMLIAQIYHIQSHYPNGVLLWTLGGLMTAYLIPSQPAMVAALALAVLWTSMESFGFERIHGAFLLVWLACLPRIFQQSWRAAVHVACIGLMLWLLFVFVNLEDNLQWSKGTELFVIQLYLLSCCALFLIGLLMDTAERFAPFAGIVQRYPVIAGLLSFYALTSPRLQSGQYWLGDKTVRATASTTWVIATLVALAAVVLLAAWHRRRAGGAARPAYLHWGQMLIAGIAALILVTLFIGGTYGGLVALAFNLLFFAGVIWLIVAGVQREDRFLVNAGFMLFTLGLLSRYVDTFWTLLNRSFFFMAGGAILILGGFFLEKQRRRLTGEILARRQDQGGREI